MFSLSQLPYALMGRLHGAQIYAIGIPGAILLCLGVPVSTLAIMLSIRKRLRQPRTTATFGFLYHQFKCGSPPAPRPTLRPRNGRPCPSSAVYLATHSVCQHTVPGSGQRRHWHFRPLRSCRGHPHAKDEECSAACVMTVPPLPWQGQILLVVCSRPDAAVAARLHRCLRKVHLFAVLPDRTSDG